MKNFKPKISGVVPPKAGDSVPVVCKKCGASCTAKVAPLVNVLVGKCPKCGGRELMRIACN